MKAMNPGTTVNVKNVAEVIRGRWRSLKGQTLNVLLLLYWLGS